LLYMPMLFLSGATIPAALLPNWAQTLAEFMPATYLVSGFQGIFFHNANLLDHAASGEENRVLRIDRDGAGDRDGAKNRRSVRAQNGQRSGGEIHVCLSVDRDLRGCRSAQKRGVHEGVGRAELSQESIPRCAWLDIDGAGVSRLDDSGSSREAGGLRGPGDIGRSGAIDSNRKTRIGLGTAEIGGVE